jgi:protein TonB
MMGETTSTAPPRVDDLTGIGRGDVIGAMPAIGPPPAAPVVVQPKPATPLRVSAGVAAGQLLTPIQPVYPFLAKATHVQGTVVIEALISKQGLVEQARVLRGPPLLAQAALSAVNAARYRPYRLNGQPVEVETTISIIFTMGD